MCDALLRLRQFEEAEAACVSASPGEPEEYEPVVRSLIEGLRSPSHRALAVESVSRWPASSSQHLFLWELLGEVDSLFSAMPASATEGEYLEYFDWLEPVWGVSGTPGRSHPRFRSLVRELGIADYWRESTWSELCSPIGDDDFACR